MLDPAQPLFLQVTSLWLGFLVSLAIFSLLIRENFLARFTLHVLVGSALGYAAVLAWQAVLRPMLIAPLMSNPAANADPLLSTDTRSDHVGGRPGTSLPSRLSHAATGQVATCDRPVGSHSGCAGARAEHRGPHAGNNPGHAGPSVASCRRHRSESFRGADRASDRRVDAPDHDRLPVAPAYQAGPRSCRSACVGPLSARWLDGDRQAWNLAGGWGTLCSTDGFPIQLADSTCPILGGTARDNRPVAMAGTTTIGSTIGPTQ